MLIRSISKKTIVGVNFLRCIFLISLFFIFNFLWTSVIAQDGTTASLSSYSNPGHDRSIVVGDLVVLDGSGSTSKSGLRLTYSWSLTEQPLGSSAVLDNADTPWPSLTPDIAGDYLAELIVTDSDGNSSAAQTVLLTTDNVPPVANAGSDRVTVIGQSLRLDPEGTYDANGDRLEAIWSVLSVPTDSTDETVTTPEDDPTPQNTTCPVGTLESLGTFHVVSATSNQQNPQLSVGQPLAEGTVETGNNSATTYFGPITMDMTGDPLTLVPENEVIEVVLSSAWGTSARAEILMSADGVNYTSLGTTGDGGSVYGSWSSNILRYDDFTVPAGGARFLQVSHQNSGVRADGVIYNVQCQSEDAAPVEVEEDEPLSGFSLTEDEGGRFVFTPELAGNYSIGLTVEDSEGAQSTDIINVYVASADETEGASGANIAPVADAGLNQVSTAGEAILLDGSRSTDVNGDSLTYQWSILSKPADSFSGIEGAGSVIASLTPDTDRTYIVQLKVTDAGGLSDFDTVVFSADNIPPVAISGGPEAGKDGAIDNQESLVDGSESQAGGNGSVANLEYRWSVLGLSEGENVIANPVNVTTEIDFSIPANEDSSGSQEAVGFLAEYNLIVFDDMDSSVDTRGRALVGGNLGGNSATFGTQIPQGQNIDALSVVGDITGGPKNINNGGNVRVGGDVSTSLNRNGGGQLINDPSLTVSSEQAELLGLSSSLAGLTANSTAEIPNPNGQHGPGRLNASPDENGLAVFNIVDGNVLFRNDRVQQIEVNANGAETIVVNVGGADIDFNRGNFVGAIQSDNLRRKIIWNFHEATDLYFERQFNGTVLAPRAHLHNRSEIRGTVVVNSLQARGAIALPSFTGNGLDGVDGAPNEETKYALVQLAVTDSNNLELGPSFSSTVLTVGNLRPMASIGSSVGAEQLLPGIEITLDGTSSTDDDNDVLLYDWSILSKPEGSGVVLDDETANAVTVSLDQTGFYVVQLIVSDGELSSRPVTIVLNIDGNLNQPPEFTSTPILTAELGQQYSYDSTAEDPENDVLIYSLVVAPDGMAIDSQTGLVTWTPLVLETVQVTVRAVDDLGASAEQSFEVVVTEPIITNAGPVLQEVANQSVDLGETLRFTLVAQDADDDPIVYSVLPLPLPVGATLDNDTGEFVFRPSASDIGVINLTFMVTDGQQSSAVEVSITVNQPLADGTTALVGRVLDANAFAETGAEIPISGAVITIDGSGATVTTDSAGAFTLVGIPSGRQTFDIDASVANLAPDGSQYTNFREGVTIIESVTNDFERPLFLSRIDPQNTIMVDPAQETVLNAESIGVRLVVPPNSIKNPDGTDYTGNLSIALVPSNLTPVEFPDDFASDFVISIQPSGLILDEPGEITLPNVLGLEPGDRVQLWTFEPIRATAIMEVGSDGESMTSVIGGITATAWSWPSPPLPRPNPENGPNENNPDNGCNGQVGSFTSLCDGNLNIEHQTAAYQSVGQSRSLTFNYDSDTASPMPIIQSSTAISSFSPPNEEVSSELILGGVSGGQRFVDTSSLSRGPATVLRLAAGIDATDFTTGRYEYDYRVSTRLRFANQEFLRSGTNSGELLINNRRNSEFGIGWGVNNLSRLFIQEDDVVITEGAGAIKFYERSGVTAASSVRLDPVPSFGLGSGEFNFEPLFFTDLNADDRLDHITRTPISLGMGGELIASIQDRQGNYSITRTYDFTRADEIVMDLVSGDFNNDGIEDIATSNIRVTGFGEGTFTGGGNLSIHLGEGEGFFEDVDVSTMPRFCNPDLPISPGGGGGGQNSDLPGPNDFPTTQVFAREVVVQLDPLLGGEITTLEFINVEGDGALLFGVMGEFMFFPEPGNRFDLFLENPDGSFRNANSSFILDNEGVTFNIEFDPFTGEETVVFLGDPSLAPVPVGLGPVPVGPVPIGSGPMMNSGLACNSIDVVNDVDGRVLPDDSDDFFQDLEVRDFNSDGNQDIIATIDRGRSVALLTGDGTGDFTVTELPLSFNLRGFDTRVLLDDINEDNLVDIIVSGSDQSFDRISEILINRGSAGFESNGIITVTSLPERDNLRRDINIENIGDINGDGLNDLIAPGFVEQVNGTGIERGMYVRYSNGDGTFAPQIEIELPDLGDTNFLVSDLNGDGFDDVYADSSGRGHFISINDGNGSFLESQMFATFEEVRRDFPEVRIADIDGDGLDEIFSQDNFNPGNLITFNFDFEDVSDFFRSPQGDFSFLQELDDGSFSLRNVDGEVILYNQQGLQTSRTDRNGNRTIFTYDGANRLLRMTDPAGLATNFEYLGRFISKVTDPAGRETLFTHDAFGNLQTVTDPDGTVREFGYDSRSRLTLQRNKRDMVTQYQYNETGRNLGSLRADGTTRLVASTIGRVFQGSLTNTASNPAPAMRPSEMSASITNGRGATTTVNLDSFGRATSNVDALGNETLITRNSRSQVRRRVTPNGAVSLIDYDGLGNISGLTQLDLDGNIQGRRSSFVYNIFSQPVRVTDFGGFVTTIDRDESGNPLTVTDPLGNTVLRTYNAQGQIETLTDQNGNMTNFTYDANGNLVSMTNAENEITELTRDLAGNVSAITIAAGTPEAATTMLEYDALNRIIRTIDGEGGETAFTYDAAGNLIETVDATGVTATQAYDELDRLIQIMSPVSGSTMFNLDESGNITRITESDGSETTFEYDLEDRLVSSLDANGGVIQYVYDANDNLVRVLTPNNVATRFTYDAFNRRVTRINAVNQITRFAYDNRDNVIRRTTPDGTALTRAYDELARLTQLSSPDNVIDLTYDAAGNVTAANDNDSTLDFVYDRANRLRQQRTGGTASAVSTLDYGFNARGILASLTDSFGGAQSYGYDNANRLNRLTTASGADITLSYDAAGRPTGITFPNGASQSSTYDTTTGLLASLDHVSSGLSLAEFDYNYSGRGDINAISESGQIGTRDRQFTYDTLRRLTSGGTTLEAETYEYDLQGNRLTSHLSATHVTNDVDRLLEDDDFTYDYDANGNLISKINKASLDQTSYTWSSEFQLTSMSSADGSVVTYAYDALGRRIGKDVDGTITTYIYDNEDIYLELDGTGALAARFAHGTGADNPLSMTRSGVDYFYHLDHQGSVRQLTDAVGTVVNSYNYDSYGRLIGSFETVAQPYGYTSREQDVESDLYYYRARYYDSNTGRFISEDPLELAAGDTNIYRYVSNNPLNLNDPTGEIPAIVVGGIGGAVVGGVAGAVRGFRTGGLRGAGAGLLTGGLEGGILGAAGSVRFVGALVAGVTSAGINSIMQLRDGAGDPCFEFDLNSALVDGLSTAGGTLFGAAGGIALSEVSRSTSRSAARELFRQGNLPQSQIRNVINGAQPGTFAQVGQGIGAAAIGATSEGLAGPQGSPSDSTAACGGCD